MAAAAESVVPMGACPGTRVTGDPISDPTSELGRTCCRGNHGDKSCERAALSGNLRHQGKLSRL